ncbi:MAG: alpha/beta hydrolase [Winogradskyella arenosi]
MTTLMGLQTNRLLMIAFTIASVWHGFSQSDDVSNGAYKAFLLQKTWQKLDPDHNQKFTEAEDKRQWRRYKHYDVNKDSILTQKEFTSNFRIPYLKTEGKRKLNVLYKTTKEDDLYLDIYYPKHINKDEKLPVVFYTHGGGWANGSRHGAANASFKTVHMALLEQGFCVVSVSYRLVEKNGTTAMRDCVIDSKDALRYISKHSETLGIDKNRFYAFGDSAGGQIAQMLVLSSPDSLIGDKDLAKYTYTMAAGVSWYGPVDFENTSLFNPDDRPNFKDRFSPRILKSGTKKEEALSLYREMSPVNYLTKDSPPLLLLQGDSDNTIPVKHAYYMEEKNKTINAPVTIQIVKNSAHNWRKVGKPIQPTRGEIVQTTIDFFVAHLK